MTTHGKTGYEERGCRCDVCKDWKAAKSRLDRQRLRQRVEAGDVSLRHGTAHLYSKGNCRCDACKAAYAAKMSQLRVDGNYRTHSKSWRERNPGRADEYRREQDALAGLPAKTGDLWTGAELEIVVQRTDLSLTELATHLRRSRAAVASARYRATHDPKWIRVVGVSGATIKDT